MLVPLLAAAAMAQSAPACTSVGTCAAHLDRFPDGTTMCHNATSCAPLPEGAECVIGQQECAIASTLPCQFRAAGVCASRSEPCYFDADCLKGGLGCNAGGKGEQCRFCGFGVYPVCPSAVDNTPARVVTAEAEVPGFCPPVCTGNPTERCFLDRLCNDPSTDPEGGRGCNAGGAGQLCRFCGFGDFAPCPTTDPTEGLHDVLVDHITDAIACPTCVVLIDLLLETIFDLNLTLPETSSTKPPLVPAAAPPPLLPRPPASPYPPSMPPRSPPPLPPPLPPLAISPSPPPQSPPPSPARPPSTPPAPPPLPSGPVTSAALVCEDTCLRSTGAESLQYLRRTHAGQPVPEWTSGARRACGSVGNMGYRGVGEGGEGNGGR